jgi:hypothetical protein
MATRVDFPSSLREVPGFIWKSMPYIAPLRWGPKYKREWIVDDIIAGASAPRLCQTHLARSHHWPNGGAAEHRLRHRNRQAARAGVLDAPSVYLSLTFVQYGLYSAFFSSFMYFLFGTSRDLTVGPTSIMSLIVAAEASTDENGNTNIADAVFLSFYGGLIQIVAALLHMGMCLIEHGF